MLTAIIFLICLLLLQLVLYCVQGAVFTFRGIIRGNDYYRKRLKKKLVAIALVICFILLLNEISKYIN